MGGCVLDSKQTPNHFILGSPAHGLRYPWASWNQSCVSQGTTALLTNIAQYCLIMGGAFSTLKLIEHFTFQSLSNLDLKLLLLIFLKIYYFIVNSPWTTSCWGLNLGPSTWKVYSLHGAILPSFKLSFFFSLF